MYRIHLTILMFTNKPAIKSLSEGSYLFSSLNIMYFYIFSSEKISFSEEND